MAELFLKIVNMSISATWLLLAVLIVRLCLKRAPKWISVALWALVGLRFLCPFSVESALSLIPSGETIPARIMMEPAPYIQTGLPFLDDAVNPAIAQSFSPRLGDSANPLQIWIPVAANLWLLGILALVLYAGVSYLRLKHRLREATLVGENIYRCEVDTPFVLGLLRPRIYLPYYLEEPAAAYVIAHEKAHIKRKDNWWKPLGYLVLCVHWFNPAVWFGYVLLCQDIELSCDEKVVKILTPAQRADYSAALLSCGSGYRRVAPCPLAFGEGRVRNRVKAVLRYKKPALWLMMFAVLLCGVIALCGLTDPVSQTGSFDPYVIPVLSFDPHDLQNRAEEIKSKLDMTGDSVFQIAETDGIRYHRGTDSARVPLEITQEEAVARAEAYLNELGLLPQNTYRTRVSFVNRAQMVFSGRGTAASETVEVRVFFYRVFNGTDVVTDGNDGITLWFDAKGIYSLQYLWRDMDAQKLPRTAKPITSQEALEIYNSHMAALHTEHLDITQDLIVFQVYASFGGIMRPCWNVSVGEMYANSCYIDMFTGEILYI